MNEGGEYTTVLSLDTLTRALTLRNDGIRTKEDFPTLSIVQ